MRRAPSSIEENIIAMDHPLQIDEMALDLSVAIRVLLRHAIS